MAAAAPQNSSLTAGPVTDPRNKHVLSVPQNKYTTYDFSPFLTAPAVQHRMLENRHQIPLVSPIPATRIPSPLAENLHPSVIKDVRDFLLGTGKYASPYTHNYTGNGEEVWASWKRAWDLWNNNYIEGRVDEVWVAGAYKQWEAYIAQQKKKGKLPFEGPGGRKQLRRKQARMGKAYRTEAKALEQLESSIDEVAQGREDFRKRAIDNLKQTLKSNRTLGNGYVEFSELLEEWHRRNWYRPRWDDFKDYKNKAPEYLPLTMDYVHDELYDDERERVLELLTKELWRKDPKLEAHPGTIEYAIAVAHWERQAEVRRCKLTSRPVWSAMKPVEDLEEKYIENASKRTSQAVIEEFRKRLDANRKLGTGYIEYSWQEAHYIINLQAHKGRIDPAILELEKPDPKDYIDKALPGRPEESAAPDNAIDRAEHEDDQDDDGLDPNDLTRPLLIEDDNSSGGLFAMKDFAEYTVPDEHDASFYEYYDPIENSVWRPRQVGEEELKIDMDEEPDAFLKNSQFEIDGGVDCGRSPYPVLRPLYRYAQSQVGPEDALSQDQSYLLKLKKFWDKVTGTIYNIPINDIDSQTLDKTDDPFHRESFENTENYQNPDIFPLDIRRCQKISTPSKPGEVVSKATDFRDTDSIIEPTFKMKEKEYRPMRVDDPWWVEMQQKYYRDMPPRSYPPKFDETQSYLPKDVKLWNDEIGKDSDLKSRYFVTNLDGRLLIINGIEVRKGEIAGPLPEFAIIQTEGGGVSFWFGVGGRFYLQPAGARTKDWSRQWSQLRRALKDEYFGLTAGYYWQNAIVGKILEDDEGEGEQDPTWIKWINAKPTRKMDLDDDNLSSRGFNENEDWGAPGPLPFTSAEAELKWVAAQFHFQEIFSVQPWAKATMVEPTADTAWGGLAADYRDAMDGPTDETRREWWAHHKSETERLQAQAGQAFEERTRQEIDAESAAAEAASLKRKADHDGYFPPDAKRFRADIEERDKEKVQDIQKQEKKQLEMGLEQLVDQINQGAKELATTGSGAPSGAQADPAASTEADFQAREALQRVRELERLRVLFNVRRKDANEVLIPPMTDPLAGLAPSQVLTLPENRWALESNLNHINETRLDKEVRETGALNHQNASERLKRDRIARKRRLGALGFTPMTDAERHRQEHQLRIKADEEKEQREYQLLSRLANMCLLKDKQAKKDLEHAAAVKDGLQAGDPVKAAAAAKKSQEELEAQQLEMVKHLSLISWAQANDVDEAQLLEYMAQSGKEFDPTDFNTWVNKAADNMKEKEIRSSVLEAAKKLGISFNECLEKVHGAASFEDHMKRIKAWKVPKYFMGADPKEAKRRFGAALLASVEGHDVRRRGKYTSWEEVVDSMPIATDWDEVVNLAPEVEPVGFGMVREFVILAHGEYKWLGIV
ncbi:hypothetical protein SBOR_4073 [Sclerotinia borealis F-4128]|uniref:Uncharacterized protein n=1 Tax=Sclerotinia borealis (strain F-4128) TaxID=1432307 RepID=W9CLK5_SCLBF|nr:hypothetical protein SBOR_4073 [Sclerotinia borealis F-4128]